MRIQQQFNQEKQILNILNEFKKENYLDFRVHKYLENNYNLSPIFNYDFAQKIVIRIHNFLIEKIEERDDCDKHNKIIYNLSMECEKLRTISLKNYLESLIIDYLNIE